GDILTVSKAFGKLGSPHAIQADGVDIGIYHNEYEVIIEESTPKFKEGDRVKTLAYGEFSDIKAGEIGEITDTDAAAGDESDPYTIRVYTDDNNDYFRPQDLELVTEEREGVRAFKKGDIVAGYSKLESRELIGIVEDVSSNGLCGVWVGDDYRALDK